MENKTKITVILGKRGVGKTTLANLLAKGKKTIYPKNDGKVNVVDKKTQLIIYDEVYDINVVIKMKQICDTNRLYLIDCDLIFISNVLTKKDFKYIDNVRIIKLYSKN